MSTNIESIVSQEYKLGFETKVETEQAPLGLNEDIIAFISKKKDETQPEPQVEIQPGTTDPKKEVETIVDPMAESEAPIL